MATATTSFPVSLPIQLIATEVSKPPEYARMTRSDSDFGNLISSLLNAFQLRGAFSAGHRLTGHYEDGVVAGDGADHIGKRSAVDSAGEIVCGPGRGAQHGEVTAGVRRHQQLDQQSRHPFGSTGNTADRAAVLGHD